MRPLLPLLISSLFAISGNARALDLSVDNPDFTVTVPRLPSVRLEPQKSLNPAVSKALAGTDGTYSIMLELTKAEKEITTRECAGSYLRAIIARPGMPDRDNIYRTALDENTFLVLYVLVEQGVQQLHAHLLSSTNTTHCIDMHFSRARRDGEDVDGWRQIFAGSHVQDSPR